MRCGTLTFQAIDHRLKEAPKNREHPSPRRVSFAAVDASRVKVGNVLEGIGYSILSG